MNVLKVIIVVGFGMMLLACGGESKRSVEGAEEGTPKAEDGRIVLSSELSDKGLVIPEGEAEGMVISSQKLANAIANHFDSISEVFDISFESEFYFRELSPAPVGAMFTVSFDVRTTKGSIYRDIECRAYVATRSVIIIGKCSSDQVILAKDSLGKRLRELKIEDSTTSVRFKDQEYMY